jgi:hypothetical protein
LETYIELPEAYVGPDVTIIELSELLEGVSKELCEDYDELKEQLTEKCPEVPNPLPESNEIQKILNAGAHRARSKIIEHVDGTKVDENDAAIRMSREVWLKALGNEEEDAKGKETLHTMVKAFEKGLGHMAKHMLEKEE